VNIVHDIVCNRCSLLCDDVQAEIGKKEAKSLGLCRLGHTHLERAAQQLETKAVYREGGKAVNMDLEKALEKAADILLTAKKPLLYGWSHSINQTIDEGLSLASTLKAVFDSSATMGLGQAMTNDLHDLKLEIDLEAVQNNGEFILYWGSNPVESSHRHTSRFTVFPRGDNIPQGVESRIIGVIDIRETETMKMANHRIIIPIGRDSELASALTMDLKGKSSEEASTLGLPSSTLIGLAQALRKSDFTVMFYGSGILNSGKTKENLSSLAELIQTLRAMGKKAYAMPMWHEPNDMGVVMSVSGLGVGFGALDYAGGQPQVMSGRNTLQRLSDGEFDVALIVGNDALISLPRDAAKGLAKTKIIYVGSSGGITNQGAALSIEVRDDIVLGSGELMRADMQDIHFKTWLSDADRMKSEFEVVKEIHQIVKAKLEKQ
jgi:formylmethanofuran dehydrogenase subunit B